MMDLRFDWFPIQRTKELDNLSSKLIPLVINQLDNKPNQGTLKKIDQLSKQILCALYAAYFVLPKGASRVSYPLTSCHYSQTDYPYRIIQATFRALKKLKWIEERKGSEASGKVTRIWAAGELSLIFDSIGLVWSLQVPKPETSLVALRDFEFPEGKTKRERGKKIDLEVPETAEVEEYRSHLYRYNQFLLQHCISLNLDDSNLNTLAEEIAKKDKLELPVWEHEDDNKVGCLDLSRVQLRRIFSRGSLEKGGRFYGGWWQSIPSRYRPHISIDGYQTTEMDYSSVALRIIYAREGHEMSEADDLYDIGLPDWRPDDDPRRKIIKTYINAILNDEFGNYRLEDKDQKKLGIKHEELHNKVLERHEPISHLFNSGIGLDAQFIDSQIAERVMLSMLHEDVLVLPIHDSFIVRTGFAEWLREDMKTAFSEIVEADVSLTIEGSRGNKHFGMSDEEYEEATKEAEVISFGDPEVWDAFETHSTSIMGMYLGSWKWDRQY